MSIRDSGNKRNGLSGNTFAATGKAEALGRGGLYAYAVDIDTQVIGNIGPHGINIRTHFGGLCDNGDIDIAGGKSFFSKEIDHTP